MALDKITTAMITDDAVTAAKIPAGAIGTTEIAEGALSVHALQNTTSHTLSGTYTDSKMYTSDAYVLGGDITVNSNLVLSSVKGDGSDITLTDDGTTRTITGTGTLEGGDLLSTNTDAESLSGVLGSGVTGTLGRYNVDFLVIAGGGGGSRDRGGGGGAGGYRTSFGTSSGLGFSGGRVGCEAPLVCKPSLIYTIEVGSGGAGAPNTVYRGGNGKLSSIFEGTAPMIISIGGGGGGSRSAHDGHYGGSGGGSSNDDRGLGGIPSAGFPGGHNTTNDNGMSGGGGGAGELGYTGNGHHANGAGIAPYNGTSGQGGAGLTSSITGSAVIRGGGGGGNNNGSGAGVGGAGGGASGGAGSTPQNGTANTGGGGGANSGAYHGGAGGSGVVILRMLTADYSGITSGSPTVSTSNIYTILVFNGAGSYTG